MFQLISEMIDFVPTDFDGTFTSRELMVHKEYSIVFLMYQIIINIIKNNRLVWESHLRNTEWIADPRLDRSNTMATQKTCVKRCDSSSEWGYLNPLRHPSMPTPKGRRRNCAASWRSWAAVNLTELIILLLF